MINTTFTKWVQLAECKQLSASQRIILITILNLHNLEEWDFTPLSIISKKNGLSVSTIQRSIDGLVEMKLIEKVSNRNRKKHGKAPNDYIPNYSNILDFLNNQIGQNDHNDNNQIGQNDHNNYSQNDHNNMVKMNNKNNNKRKKEKNNSLYNSTYNISTCRYMVYPENVNENKQKPNNMNIIITTDTKNGNPTNALLGFDEADKRGFDSSTNEETATDTAETQINDRGQVLTSDVVSCSTETEKTQQEQNKEEKRQTDTEDEETDSPTDGDNTNTRRMMNQALQRLLKNRRNRNTAETTDENEALNDDPYKSPRQKTHNAFNASIKREETAATDTAETQNNDRREDLTPQMNSCSTRSEKTPQTQNFNDIWEADTAATENGANTAAARPIFNTIYTAAEWEVRHAEDSCWQETFEHNAANLANPSESEIRTLLNKAYKDWKNHDQAINAKMITDMKKYVTYKYQICLDKKEKRETVTCQKPTSEAYPTAAEIENLDLCHISKNKDILNRLSAGCKRLDTVIISLQKAIEFTQIYRLATPQLYDCITNAMALIDNYPTVSDKKAKYVTDLATHLCEMLQKIK